MRGRAIRRFIPPLLHDAPDFRRLWLGQTISVFGDQSTGLGLPLTAVLTLGADASQMGLLTAVGLLPHLLFSMPAGIWLDRVRSRRRMMIAADLARAAVIGSIPLAFAVGALSMPQLYVAGFLTGTLAVVFDLSWNTLFVSVTRRERYVEAMSLLNGSRSLAYVGGPTIGGLLVQVLGAPLAMLTDALSYFGSVAFLHRIRSTEHRSSLREGRSGSACWPGLPSCSAMRSSGPRCSRWRRSTCSTSRSPRCSCCMRRRPSASRPGRSAWPSVSAPSEACLARSPRHGSGGASASVPRMPSAASSSRHR